MSATQSVLTGGGVAAAFSVVLSSILPAPPIEVHSLTYDAGYIIQDRTVATDGPWLAVWNAAIIDAATGKPVDDCEGGGVWQYPSGRMVARVPLTEWVGSSACRLGPGSYQPIATYAAGEFKTVKRGDVFEVGG